ncbi:MAG: Holliday junction branch migration protein RuvA [Calditrichaeota bacterium]|nr:Holliday junction branch migration protein RuvA [Calditrichota bacterium]
MISYVCGKIAAKAPTSITIEINGFGLEILIPLSTFEAIGEPDANVRLLTYLHVREDALILFGFATVEEKELFRNLLSVSGIGPKLALGIISGSKIPELYKNIADGNEAALTRVKGLGKKTAQRLIIDLKDKAEAQVGRMGDLGIVVSKVAPNVIEEAMLAMMSLGYSRNEAEKAISKVVRISDEGISVEKLVRDALNG